MIEDLAGFSFPIAAQNFDIFIKLYEIWYETTQTDDDGKAPPRFHPDYPPTLLNGQQTTGTSTLDDYLEKITNEKDSHQETFLMSVEDDTHTPS